MGLYGSLYSIYLVILKLQLLKEKKQNFILYIVLYCKLIPKFLENLFQLMSYCNYCSFGSQLITILILSSDSNCNWYLMINFKGDKRFTFINHVIYDLIIERNCNSNTNFTPLVTFSRQFHWFLYAVDTEIGSANFIKTYFHVLLKIILLKPVIAVTLNTLKFQY